MVRKKTLRLLLYDYQRTDCYYTIYRTFKQWSSDDFTTICREKLRLFKKLLRLFQPEHYDYCSPLLAIGRKPEKRYGGSRQWFRASRCAPATGLPRRVEGAGLTRCALTADRCQTASRWAWEASRPRRAGMVCDMLHCLAWIHDRGAPLHPYIHYYNRRLC